MKPGHRAIDIWIGEPDARNRGYGAQMMEQAIARCFADPSVHTILIDPLVTTPAPTASTSAWASNMSWAVRSATTSCSVYKLNRPDDTRGHA